MYDVYKLEFNSGKVYIGVTSNYTQRLINHKIKFNTLDTISSDCILGTFKDVEAASLFENTMIQLYSNNSYNKQLYSSYSYEAPQYRVILPYNTTANDIITDVGTNAINDYSFRLLALLLTEDSINFNYIAKALDWSRSKVARAKRDLINADLIFIEKIDRSTYFLYIGNSRYCATQVKDNWKQIEDPDYAIINEQVSLEYVAQ